MMSRDLVEFTVDGEGLVGRWGTPSQSGAGYPLVVLATGDSPNGSKGQTWEQLVPMLTQRGIGTFLFDFAGLGHSPGTYADLTLSRGCRDFRGAMEFVSSHGDHDKERIGVIGSSFGGNVALLEAANFPQIKAVGLKSASTFLPEGYQIEIGTEKMEEWGRTGFLEEVGHTYDIVLDSLLLNTYEAASRIEAAVRIVHGTADSSVPIRHSRDLLKILKNGSILEIDGADHWYAEGHEWQQMADDLVDFMAVHL
jgi:pimeloyl-ACP methyl ester carboxylesterase